MTKPFETLEFLGFMGKELHFRDGSVITIDGSSGSGKSTLSQRLAAALGWPFLDSGAWYRALTWAVLESKVEASAAEAVLSLLFSLKIHSDSCGQVFVDGIARSSCLRTPRIDQAVPLVANHPQVRQALNARMRGLVASSTGVGFVADGRDAGTIIFPDAVLKVFVKASLEVRAERRLQQMLKNEVKTTLPEVRAALAQRDAIDAARGDAAPHPTDRSRILVNENQTVEEAVGCLLTWVAELQA